MWTGTAYGVASFMLAMNLSSEGFNTAAGVYNSCWNRHGLQYQTPEAICGNIFLPSLAENFNKVGKTKIVYKNY